MTSDPELIAAKKAARAAAVAARAEADAAGFGAARQAAAHALAAVAHLRHVAVVSGYMPMRSEIDPRPAMLALIGAGFRVSVPVIEAPGLPLRFRAWTPDAALVPGPYGLTIPATGEDLDPDVLLVPLLAFDAQCRRLGYGGGFYDRTIAALRERREVKAYGFAYAVQRVAAVPNGSLDAALDAVITERGIVWPE